MKRKFLAKAITLGLMLAVPFSAYAEEIPPYAQGVIINNVDGKTAADVSGDMKVSLDIPTKNFANINNGIDYITGLGTVTNNQEITMNSANITNSNFVNSAGDTEIAGIFNLQGSVNIVNNVNIKLSGENKKDDTAFCIFGIRSFWHTKYNAETGKYEPDKDYDDTTANISIGGDTNIDISGQADYLAGILLQKDDGTELTLKGNTTIKVTDTSKNGSENLYGIFTPYKSILRAQSVNIEINGGQKQIGLRASNGNTQKDTNVQIDDLDIILKDASTSAIGVESYDSIPSQDKAMSTRINNLKISISSDLVDKKENLVGLKLYSNNSLSIDGNVDIDVANGYAITTNKYNDIPYQNKSLILGSDDGSKTVKIKGDILSSERGSGVIKLNLTNSDSYFTGTNTGKTDITLKDGATWTNTGESTVSSLDVKGATLVQGSADATIKKSSSNDMRGSDQKFTISGNNTIALNTTSDGSAMKASKQFLADDLFNTGAYDTEINLTSANQNAADVSKENSLASFDKLAEALGTQLKDKVKTAHLDGSYTKNAIDAEVGSNGKFASGVATQSDADTDTVAAIKKLPSINLVSWRTENNELSKRLGEVRDYDGEEGIWVRMNHGESKYLDSFETKGHLYQMGYDKKVGEWRLGGAVSYNKGTTTYENGNGKNRSTSLALYGAWLGDKGHYADIIVKEGKQKSELTIGQAGLAASNLDYDLWATSISAEYGRNIALKSDWFVEPQAELTYGRLGSADYGDNGFTVHQDSMDSLVGRMGFRLGKNLSDTSNIYMKASVLHEFCGDVDYSFTEGTNSKVSSVDLGDTWYEVGVGGSAQIGKATYAYAGIEKTFGGDFSTPWQWNAGVRWSF